MKASEKTIGVGRLSFAEAIDLSPEDFQILVHEAEQRLEACGIPRGVLGKNFVRYWLLHGMSPAKIVEIACGRTPRAVPPLSDVWRQR